MSDPAGVTVQSVHRFEVPFAGGRSAQAPMTWGQIALWDVLAWLPPGDASLNLVLHCEVPPGTTSSEVGAAVAALVGRHESLRSRYLDRDGELVQQVVGEGAVPVEVFEAGTATTAGAAAVVANQLRVVAFDGATDPPLRVGMITRAGVPVWLVLVLHHLAVDGWSLRILKEDLTALLRGGPPGLRPAGTQPVERAGWERSEPGRQRNRRSLDFWRGHLERLPPVVVGCDTGEPGTDLEWSELRSTALTTAATSLGGRHRLSPALVVHAGLLLVIGAYLGERQVATRMIVATRFAAEQRRLVGAFNQNALFCLTVADEPFSTYLLRAAEAELLAYRHSEYDLRALHGVLAEVGAARAVPLNGFCFFNDVRADVGGRQGVGRTATPEPTAELLARQRAASRINRLTAEHRAREARLFFYLHALAPKAFCSVGVDPGFAPGRTSADLLADLEWLLLHACRADDSAETLWRALAGARAAA
ncbi:condensation domain-containing protein [Micromonospora sp. NPDC092111]|uniref:condensation domain-containing protein n=1 Tax=Micromonospora sp. NPDC092111 TaxID=3364289 RepID=UPI003815ADC3